ncbi:E3 ubiquitin protein ligase RIN2 [Ananas comosus]|uniref:E3 ubiquitin protein ligase RIN2 n=1 Tax=Ananas comosus TaxID=4615 RepID=A0A199UFE7_ANACO|nr:E3 ubiquitin protein ligase RIN2 [Ananas comosus]
MAVNYLYTSVVATSLSVVGLIWWSVSFLDGLKGDGAASSDRPLDLLLGSHVTIALLVNLAINLFFLLILCLKVRLLIIGGKYFPSYCFMFVQILVLSIFFVQLHPSETRKLLERIINYVIYKGTFLPLVVPPNVVQVSLWSTWLIFLCSLKMFQSLAKDRLELLNASPTATPMKYLRVYSALLLVLSADFLWMKFCTTIYGSYSSPLFVLLFFEPLSIAFETLQAIMVHGFQLFEIWQRHSMDSGADFFDFQASYKKAAGSLYEWRGILIRNCGFLVDMMTLSMALGHYLMIWWLRGMAFHLADAVLVLNLRALVTAIFKRIKAYIKLRKALSSLNGALPDASYEELCAYNDECAICRGPMARAKKLSCSHLFHLACLRSWLDQGLTEVYSCPTCRRPLFLSAPQRHTGSIAEDAADGQQLAEQFNLGLNQQGIPGHALPVGAFPDQQQNPSDAVWSRGAGLDSGWVPSWSNSGTEGAGSSSAIRSVGLSGVQMMMRQLASVSENYSQGGSSWNLWPSHSTAGSSAAQSSSHAYNRGASGLRFRSTSPANGNMTEVLSMAERVREVLPHIPDELIIQDLLRTNNINITVNNLLLMQ